MPFLIHSRQPNAAALAATLGVRLAAADDLPPTYQEAVGDGLRIVQVNNRHSTLVSKSTWKDLQHGLERRQRTDIKLSAARYLLGSLQEQLSVESALTPITSVMSVGSGLFEGGRSERIEALEIRVKQQRTKVRYLEEKKKTLAEAHQTRMRKLETELLKVEARQRPDPVTAPL